MKRIIPLHKISDTSVDYLGFTTGNQWFIVKAEVDAVYTTRVDYTFWSTLDADAYTAAINNPTSVTFGTQTEVELQLDLSFIFNIV